MKYRVVASLLTLLLGALGVMAPACGGGEEEAMSYGPAQVHLPNDEGSHPTALVEWWYLNSNLEDAEGREYTAMVAYFRPTLKIISISDVQAETFYHEVPSSWELSHAHPAYAEGHLDLRWNDSDHWYRTGEDDLSYRLEASGRDIGLALDITSQKSPLMVGGDGLMEWAQGNTYYYSLTRLAVEGQITLEDKTIDVEGIGWMDHQWMDSMAEAGWDWFSVQLDDDTELIFWQIINSVGSVTSMDLTMMFPDESIYHTDQLELEKLETWVSPDTGKEYGVTWRVSEERQDLDLKITARYPAQEILLFHDQPDYAWQFWEGGTTVSGRLKGKSVSGVGYAELVPMRKW